VLPRIFHSGAAAVPPEPTAEELLRVQLRAARYEMAQAQDTIGAMERQALGHKHTIEAQANEISDLTARNAALSERLADARRPAPPAPAPSRPGVLETALETALRAEVRRLTEGVNAQANVIAHQRAALDGRAPVHLGGWR
jgi:hypothetical protein